MIDNTYSISPEKSVCVRHFSIVNLIAIIARLCKWKISLAVVATTATGILFQRGQLAYSDIINISGILFMAGGACALNEVQDWRMDALMMRTKQRPIASGEISVMLAAIIGVSMTLVGAIALLATGGAVPMLMGLAAVFWYNGIYTPLKRQTYWAFIPGAIVGAMPPPVGWLCGGGHWPDARFAFLLLFITAWQLPHFWNLMLAYQNDYERAGFPIPRNTLSEKRIYNIGMMLAILTAVAAELPFAILLRNHYLAIGVITAFALVWIFLIRNAMTNRARQEKPLMAFHMVNILGVVEVAGMIALRLI